MSNVKYSAGYLIHSLVRYTDLVISLFHGLYVLYLSLNASPNTNILHGFRSLSFRPTARYFVCDFEWRCILLFSGGDCPAVHKYTSCRLIMQ
jgi:hypothetical protein